MQSGTETEAWTSLDLYIKLYSLDEYVCVDGAATLHNIQKNYTAKSINVELVYESL